MLFEDAVQFVRDAYDFGINFLDTSFYPIGPHETLSGPHTEVIFGRILQASGITRSDYVLSEKLWFYPYPEQSLSDQMSRSLFRLGVDHIDLVSVAMPRPELDLRAVLGEIAGRHGAVLEAQIGTSEMAACLDRAAESQSAAVSGGQAGGSS